MNINEVRQHANINWLESEKATQQKNAQKVYSIARPILVFLSNFFIIPKKVRLILSHLIEVLDTIKPIFEINSVSSI